MNPPSSNQLASQQTNSDFVRGIEGKNQQTTDFSTLNSRLFEISESTPTRTTNISESLRSSNHVDSSSTPPLKTTASLARPISKPSYFIQKSVSKQADKMDHIGKYKEKTLGEIGFDSIEIPNWDQIVQPDKADLLQLLKKMITGYDKTNVKIKIDDIVFNCHMMVLQCYSDFFADKTLEQVVVLPSDKVTPQAFIMVYDWMLSNQPMVQRQGILELFNAAQFLRIKDLVNQCWVCLDDEEKFSEDAAFLLYLESRNYGHKLIKQLMLTRVCKFFLTLVASKEFLELSLEEVCTLFQSNTIGVNAESEVLMAAVRWLDYDWENREKCVIEVIKCVRFGLMAPWQLVELGRKSDSPEVQRVVDNPEVRKMIEDGLSYVTTKYWHSNHTENFVQLMEQLNLKEPTGRQFVHDKTWVEQFVCPNQNYNSYNTFLKYLEMIRTMGREHWKTLTYHEGNPNKLLKGNNTTDTLFLHYFTKIVNPAQSATKMEEKSATSVSSTKSKQAEFKNSATSTSNLCPKQSKRVGTADSFRGKSAAAAQQPLPSSAQQNQKIYRISMPLSPPRLKLLEPCTTLAPTSNACNSPSNSGGRAAEVKISRNPAPDEFEKYSKYFEEINYDARKSKKIYKFHRGVGVDKMSAGDGVVTKSDVHQQKEKICRCRFEEPS